jgi:hypothetical protein
MMDVVNLSLYAAELRCKKYIGSGISSQEESRLQNMQNNYTQKMQALGAELSKLKNLGFDPDRYF